MSPQDNNMSLPSPVDNNANELHNVLPNADSLSRPDSASVSAENKAVDTTATTMPAGNPEMMANDDDLIEKEWVDKVERIIKNYKNDPYNQAKQFNLLKVDYIKKRYNKIIATED